MCGILELCSEWTNVTVVHLPVKDMWRDPLYGICRSQVLRSYYSKHSYHRKSPPSPRPPARAPLGLIWTLQAVPGCVPPG